MAAVRYLLSIVVACSLPLSAMARATYQFRPEQPTARGVDSAKLNAILPKLQITTSTMGTIKPSGGTLKLNGLTLEFPKGAVSKPTKVHWTALSHPDILFGYVLEPRDTRLAKPLTLHSPQADLVFQLNRLGAYVLMADRANQAFHLVNLAVTVGPAKKPAAGKKPPSADKSASAKKVGKPAPGQATDAKAQARAKQGHASPATGRSDQTSMPLP